MADTHLGLECDECGAQRVPGFWRAGDRCPDCHGHMRVPPCPARDGETLSDEDLTRVWTRIRKDGTAPTRDLLALCQSVAALRAELAAETVFIDELAKRRCEAGYHTPPWQADTCLGMRDYARAHPYKFGEPLRTQLMSGADLCDPCRAKAIRAARSPTLDSGTYGELPAEIRAMILGHEWDNMTRDEQRAWLIRTLVAKDFAALRAELAEARDLFDRYGGHALDCPAHPLFDVSGPCACGYDDAASGEDASHV